MSALNYFATPELEIFFKENIELSRGARILYHCGKEWSKIDGYFPYQIKALASLFGACDPSITSWTEELIDTGLAEFKYKKIKGRREKVLAMYELDRAIKEKF